MAIPTKDFQTIQSEMKTDLQATVPNASQAANAVLSDVFVNAPSAQLAALNRSLSTASQLNLISEASGQDLDRLVANYGLTRRGGQAAQGTIFFVLSNNLEGANITIPDGSAVSSRGAAGTTSVDFNVLGEQVYSSADREVYAALADRYRNQLIQAGLIDVNYIASAPIQALTEGSSGIVGAYAITVSNIADVITVVNFEPTSGGRDAESDESLRVRAQLVFSGSSVGTTDGIRASALDVTGVESAFVVGPGDQLMTRDGTVYDNSGNLVTEGTGNKLDVYIVGSSLQSATNSYTFQDKSDTDEIIDFDNDYILGQQTDEDIPRLQPVKSITSIIGSQSGANFTPAIEVQDDEGNVVMVGEYMLLKDFEAGNYKLIRNKTTRELSIAKKLSTDSQKYDLVETLIPSEKSNSAFGQDRIIWLNNKANIENELIVRGTDYNGLDELRFTGVTNIESVSEDFNITREVIQITNESSFDITTRHFPIVSVSSIKHVRLGTPYNYTIKDADSGVITLEGRFPPQYGDYLEITYLWKKNYLPFYEFTLSGNSVDWIEPENEYPKQSGVSLLSNTSLAATNTLERQPLTPTFLSVNLANAVERATYDMTFSGTIGEIKNEGQADAVSKQLTTSPNDFVFDVRALKRDTASSAKIGRVTRVRNVSKGFNYNLFNYKMASNEFDIRADVDSELENDQFAIDYDTNMQVLKTGDKLRFAAQKNFAHWSSDEDFSENIRSNVSPVFDATRISIGDGEVQLVQREKDSTLPVEFADSIITGTTTWSNKVIVDSNVNIPVGAHLKIEAGTIIEVTSSDELGNVETVTKRVYLDDPVDNPDGEPCISNKWKRIYYAFFREGVGTPFFVILNDSATDDMYIRFNSDVIAKVKRDDGTFYWTINGELISSDFETQLQEALNTSGTMIGVITDQVVDGETVELYEAPKQLINGEKQYAVFIDALPRELSTSVPDITISKTSNPNIIVNEFDFQTTSKVIFIDGSIQQDVYNVEYGIETINRLSITVDGTLTIENPTSDNPVIFTSSADVPQAGDWEGIVFNQSSRTDSSGSATTQSDLTNVIVKYANVGVKNTGSDVELSQVICKHCFNNGIDITSTVEQLTDVTDSSYQLLDSMFDTQGITRVRREGTEGIPYGSFMYPSGSYGAEIYGTYGYAYSAEYGYSYGYTYGYGDYGYTCDYGYGYGQTGRIISTRAVYFTVDRNMVLCQEAQIPSMENINQIYSVAFLTYDRDYTITYQGKDITNISAIPGCSFYLRPGIDFGIEYDAENQKFKVAFYNTGVTTVFLENNAKIATAFKLNFCSALVSGSINNCIFVQTGTAAIKASKLATVNVYNNVIHKNSTNALTIENSFIEFFNNIVTEYDRTPIIQDEISLASIRQNDMYSSIVEDREKYQVVDTDTLLKGVLIGDRFISPRFLSKFKVGQILQIDNEQMLVESVSTRVRVTRAINDTTEANHLDGAEIVILRNKAFFSVTGVPGVSCTLVYTNSIGEVDSNTLPVKMILVADNTFYTAFPIDRKTTFYYKYRFTQGGETTYSSLRKFSFLQPGNAVNDTLNVIQKATGNDSTNFSDDPLYTAEDAEGFTVSSSSFCSTSNSYFATPWNPVEKRLRYLGNLDTTQTEVLNEGATYITLDYDPIITETITTDISIVNQLTSVELTPSYYDSANKRLYLTNAITLKKKGTYIVTYKRAVDLGSSIPAFYFTGSIRYQFLASSEVDWLKWRRNLRGAGGEITFSYRTAQTVDGLDGVAFSEQLSGESVELKDSDGIYPRGNIIEFDITLAGNDGSFDTEGNFSYPALEDFTLEYSPRQDISTYEVKSVNYNAKFDKTEVGVELVGSPGNGISSSTYQNVAAYPRIIALVVKSTGEEFALALVRDFNVNAVVISLEGNVAITKAAPSTSDEILVDFLWANLGDQEQLTFVQDATQLTTKRFLAVDQISTTIIEDRIALSPSDETISVDFTNQSLPGATYAVNYNFEAPKDGETLTVNFVYNDLVRTVQNSIEANQDALADILAREVFEVQLTIKAQIVIEEGFNSTAVITQVTANISQFLENFSTTRPTGGGRIDAKDTEAVIKQTDGVDDLLLTEHHRDGYTGVTNVVLNEREFPALAAQSPEILAVSASAANTTLGVSN